MFTVLDRDRPTQNCFRQYADTARDAAVCNKALSSATSTGSFNDDPTLSHGHGQRV